MRNSRRDQRDRDRFSAYSANESFYNGEGTAQLTVTSAIKRDEVRAVFNYARDILNKHAAATINGLESEVIDDPAGQVLLDQTIKASGGFQTDFAAVLAGCVLGDSGYYLSHDDGDVMYRVLHPGDLDVLDWTAHGEPARVMVQHDDRIETWTPQWVSVEGNGLEALPQVNPYGVIPVVVWPNWPRVGSRWGDSTLEHIKSACRLLNERVDLLMWLMRVQGNPPIKALGVDKASLRTDPGELWTGPADAAIDLVKLMDAETAGIHQQTIQLLLSIVKELSNTPDIAYGIGNTQLSGRALEMAYLPMIQAANIRRGYLEIAIQRRNRIALRMSEILQGIRLKSHETKVTFTSVVPADRYADREQDRLDMLNGSLDKATYAMRYLA